MQNTQAVWERLMSIRWLTDTIVYSYWRNLADWQGVIRQMTDPCTVRHYNLYKLFNKLFNLEHHKLQRIPRDSQNDTWNNLNHQVNFTISFASQLLPPENNYPLSWTGLRLIISYSSPSFSSSSCTSSWSWSGSWSARSGVYDPSPSVKVRVRLSLELEPPSLVKMRLNQRDGPPPEEYLACLFPKMMWREKKTFG